MKDKGMTKSGIAVEELENAFIELNKDYEEIKKRNNGLDNISNNLTKLSKDLAIKDAVL